MEIFINWNPQFTKWLVRSGTLHEPFVLVDVGVLGGENPRWHFLGDHLIVHGFDAIKEAVGDLSRKISPCSNRTYHWLAIGNEDGDREFFFKPSNPTNSSFYRAPGAELQSRTIPVRKLDTLFKEGIIPKVDFLKVDVEGFERDVFWGAENLLAAGILGVESETSFGSSIFYPQTHFGLIKDVLLKHGLVVSDLNFNRVRRSAYQEARRRRTLPELPLEGAGKPSTFNVLFCRDIAAERTGSLFYESLPAPATIDQILKLLAIYELHGLNDIAVDTAMTFANELGQRLDVERVIDLLCGPIDEPIDLSREYVATLENAIKNLHASTSWRLTAPLRAIMNVLRGSR